MPWSATIRRAARSVLAGAGTLPPLALRRHRYGFVAVEYTSDISSNSSVGSFALAAPCDEIIAAAATVRPVEGECDCSIVVAAAIRTTVTNPEIIRRFMGNLSRFGERGSLRHFIIPNCNARV
jgi:hypothetical protein